MNNNTDDKKDPVSLLIELGKSRELFHDAEGNTYSDINVKGRTIAVLLKSTIFKDDLSYRYYTETKNYASEYYLKEAVNTLHSIAKFEGEEKVMHTRVARLDDRVIIDTCRKADQYVIVSSEGIDYTNQVAEKFFFNKTSSEHPELSAYEDILILRKYVNLDDTNFALLLGYLYCILGGIRPYPLLILQGEQGTGKSTLTKVIRALLDPSTIPLRTAPKSVLDLMVSASNGYLLVLDNLSGINPAISDALCCLSTGGGMDQRKLHTNCEQYIVDIQRPVIVNGISDIATRPDLAERSIIIELPVIDPSNRRSEKEFWAEFEKDKSDIFTGILDGIVNGFQNMDDVVLEEKPRMADVVQWVQACEYGLNMQGSFMAAYKANQASSKRDGIDSSPIGNVLLKLMSTQREFVGTTTELLNKLSMIAGIKLSNSRMWPQSPKKLNSDIKRITPNFRSLGITISKGDNNKREYHIVNTRFNGDVQASNNATGINN